MGKVKCIRSWSECSKVVRDSITGNLFGVDFDTMFIEGKEYNISNEDHEVVNIINEKNTISDFEHGLFENFFVKTA